MFESNMNKTDWSKIERAKVDIEAERQKDLLYWHGVGEYEKALQERNSKEEQPMRSLFAGLSKSMRSDDAERRYKGV